MIERKTALLAMGTVAGLIILLPLESVARSNLPVEGYRMYAGFVLSIISTTAFAVFVQLVNTYRHGGSMKDIDPSNWTRPFSVLAMICLFVFGLLIFWASWEGKGTGIWYGIGFLAGALLTEAGVGRAIKSETRTAT